MWKRWRFILLYTKWSVIWTWTQSSWRICIHPSSSSYHIVQQITEDDGQAFFARKRDKAFSFWAKDETWYRRQTNCNIEAITAMYLFYYEKIYCLLVFPPTLFHKGSDHLWSMLMLLFHLCFIFNFNLCRDCISIVSSLLLFFKCHIP